MPQYKQYDPAVLEHLQNVMSMMLADFDEICHSHGIVYFGHYGTAIGALRHHGFIPWDDDLDLCMPRKDYEHLADVIRDEYSDKYLLIDAESFDNYPLMTGHLVLRGTVLKDEPFKNLDVPLGIYLDLFPWDNLADDEQAREHQKKKSWFYNKIMILRATPDPHIEGHGLMSALLRFFVRIAHYITVLFRVSNQKLYKKTKALLTEYEDVDTELIGFPCDTDYNWNVMRKSDLLPLKRVSFDGGMIDLPSNIEEQLQHIYGDYMQLPPERDRKNHYPAVLDFGKY